MAKRIEKIAQRIVRSRALTRWKAYAQDVDHMDIATLRKLQLHAQQMREPFDRIIAAADLRLSRPRVGTQSFANKPTGTDWTWRPQAWSTPLRPHAYSGMASKDRVGHDIAIFHDCSMRELTLRQLRNRFDQDLAPFALRLEALGFEGSFLSLALDLPESAFDGLTANHVFQLTALASKEREMGFFARLNIKNGPNTTQMVSELRIPQGAKTQEASADFDLAYANFNPQRVQHIWVDLIFEGITMNQITLRDLTITRHLRAEM